MSEVYSIDAADFKFARGFQMPDDRQLEDMKLDIIKWGNRNLFPNFLNNLLYSSAYQSGIIRGKVGYIVGSGYSGQGVENLNFGDFNLQDILDAVCFDSEMYNALAIRVKRSLDGSKSYEHIDFDMLRIDKYGRGWWYSDDWSQSMQSEEHTNLKLYRNYEPDNLQQFDSIYVGYLEKPKNNQTKTSKKGQVYQYPQPVYIGCLKSLMTDVEIQSFHLYNIINGMKVSGALNFGNGEPPNKSEFERAVKDAITPSENSGGVMITYSDGDDRKVAWVPFTGDDLDKRYLVMQESTIQNIMTGHGVTSGMLFGIKTPGQIGGNTEMDTAFNIFVKTYVRNKQKFIEEHFNYVTDGQITLNEPSNPLVSTPSEDSRVLNNISTLSPLVATKVLNSMTQNEIRDLVSLGAVEGGDVVKIQEFKSEEKDVILEELKKCGKDKKGYKVLCTNDWTEDFDFDAEENKLKSNFLSGKFSITDLESRVLSLLRKGETLDAVMDALDDDNEEIAKSYAKMVSKGLIKGGELTSEGIRELAQHEPDFELEILYSYELRPNAPELKTQSREFCTILMELGRFYTRAEIDQISERVGRDVWRYRGGWYSDPTKERPTPSCRHVWRQNLTIKR